MAFTIGAGQPPRIRSVPARCTSLVLNEIKKAMLRFDLPADAPVLSCYGKGNWSLPGRGARSLKWRK